MMIWFLRKKIVGWWLLDYDFAHIGRAWAARKKKVISLYAARKWYWSRATPIIEIEKIKRRNLDWKVSGLAWT